MKTFVVLVTLWLSGILAISAQEDNNSRYIEVTGSSETEIIPDEIHFMITIKEYWQEEFEKKSKPEDYQTKVPVNEIEHNLMSALKQAGIDPSDIQTKEVGDYWRERGKDFLISKTFDIKLQNPDQINRIIQTVNTKGIQSMNIGELKNKDLQEYRKQGKIEALKAARQKADYLVAAMGQKLGNVLRIVEPEERSFSYFQPQSAMSNVAMPSYDSNPENFRTIKLRYQMTARFEILPAE
ncbi:SIMPL domain-containing protein [Bacteroides salyersiae]|uniref:SIMPL domain-containing protein n=1 Tax=Bacteroides salyersiae TaxID=291644 RepID=UPI002220E14A|nr:SIMPL domain-containing protein [Bacteroides salyersiae]UYU42712.1 SIMPL domain-containing protein [Bacteroides salyersiae]